MNETVSPRLFLERRSYRQRRLIDALRLLPFLGVVLWLVPLIWSRDNAEAATINVVSASLFIFAVWAGLTVLSAVLVARLGVTDDTRDNDPAQMTDDGAA